MPITCESNCLRCSSEKDCHCNECIAGFYLIGAQCVVACPNRFYTDIISSTCRPCGIECEKCVEFPN